jgi:cation:H+ antiporter
MLVQILLFLALSAVIVTAGTYLARFGDALGGRIGLGRTLAGMLLLATATSLPEFAVDASAAWLGAPDLAIGDLLGSCLFNLLILAVLDMLYRTGGAMLSRKSAAHALAAVSCILLTGTAVFFLLLGDRAHWGAFRLGPGSVAIVVVYAACARLIFFDQQYQLAHAEPEAGDSADRPVPQMTFRQVLAAYLASAAVILAAAPFLANTADELARRTSLGGTFFGTIFVALATSLPEISSCRAAVRIGAFDLAVGNILGSNSFNILLLAAVDVFYGGHLLASSSPTHAVTGLAVILITAVVTLGLLYRAERRLWLIEYDAALVVLLTLGAFGVVYWLER